MKRERSAAGNRLETYRRKRDPARTPEPFGGIVTTRRIRACRFVVQQHAARRLHWDLRLEIGGVLVSWAVPRGPSFDPAERRLAVQTEDHPLDYLDFEAVIPAGNYGAGAMIVWDCGQYAMVDDADPASGLEAGKLDFELCGHKLRGRWALVRTKDADGRQWLLLKKADAAAGIPEPVERQPQSVFSGLTVEELAAGVRRDAALAAAAEAAGAPRAPLPPRALAPMLAETVEEPFSRLGWLFELKYDGIRVLLVRRGGAPLRLLGRSGRDLTAQYPDIIGPATHLPCDDFVIDGELVAIDPRGTGSFERLQRRLGLTNPWDIQRGVLETPLQVHAFDLLAAAGHDLRALPLVTRKALLRTLVPPQGIVRYVDHIEEAGTAFYEATAAHGIEGIIAKRADSPYRSGQRSRDWLKIKHPRRAELAVVGYLPGKGTRAALGALMLGWRRNGTLVHAGNVGSGLSPSLVAQLRPQLDAAVRREPAFEAGAEPLPRTAVFVEPRLRARVRYTEVTERGALRQPVLEAILDDGDPAAIAEAPANGSDPATTAEAIANAPQPAVVVDAPPAPRPRVTPTNVDKVYWPDDGYTKGDLLAYYDAIWPAIAPYLRDRPLVLTRFPDGITGKSFYQQNAPPALPDWMPTCRVENTEYVLCNERDALRYIVNSGSIPLHMWSARCGSIERPDWAILDLDPKDAPLRDVITVARRIHALLAPLDAPHYIKTSGQKGLHILLPLGRALTHDQARTFAEVLARLVVADLPEIATVTRAVAARGGKVYVDYLQNGAGKTIVAPFAVRPQPGAPVSTPLTWREVTARLDPARFTIKTVPPRVASRGDPMLPLLEERLDIAGVLAALQEQLDQHA